MTTTRRSNFSAALRTTLLLAGLGGLLVVIGALDRRREGAAGFLVIALVINLGMYWFSDKIALRRGAREARLRGGGPAALPDGPRPDHARRACRCRSST